MYRDRHDIEKFLAENPRAIVVTVEEAKGSTPREAGAFMLVSPGSIFATIGGGMLEYMAIDRARQLLKQDLADDGMDLPLGPEIGQCCGGHARLSLRLAGDRERGRLAARVVRELDALPAVYIFGAGHVGRNLARAMSLLPVRLVLVDTRAGELGEAPDGIETELSAMPEDVVRRAPAGSAFVVLTHDHSLDFIITAEALARDDGSYVGMIGSATKRELFERWLKSEEAETDASALVCPIGDTGSSDKRPEVIASFVAAEIMTRLTGGRSNDKKSRAKARKREDS